MMRKTLFTGAAVLLTFSGVAVGSEKTPTAFVGSFVKIVKVECKSGEATDASTGEAVILLCMDSVFRATYRVEQVLEGKLVTGTEVTFKVADHYGFPKFAEQKRALIFLGEHEGGYYHIKYQWEPAYRTNDGEFAQCGCDEEEEGEALDCRSLSFSPVVTEDLTHVSQYVIDKRRASLDYKVEGNKAVCMRGVLVSDVYKRRRPELVEDLNAPR
jgi:hypothetical protein